MVYIAFMDVGCGSHRLVSCGSRGWLRAVRSAQYLLSAAVGGRDDRADDSGQAEAVRSCGARRRGAQDRGNAKSAGGQAVRCERRAAVRPGRGQGSTTLSLLRFQAAGKRRATGTGTAVAAVRSRDRASSLSRRPDDAR